MALSGLLATSALMMMSAAHNAQSQQLSR
jgi:hypothetical protein